MSKKDKEDIKVVMLDFNTAYKIILNIYYKKFMNNYVNILILNNK